MNKNCLVVTLILVFILTGCKGGSNAPEKAKPSGVQGTTTGGGGDVKPADQVEEKEIIAQVKYSKYVVASWYSRKYLHYQERKKRFNCDNFAAQDCAIGAKLFDGPKTVFDVLEQLEIETKTDGPCRDNEGSPKDGSINGKAPGSICISVSSLKRKLTKENYGDQIAALIAHEVGHLLKTSEEEAVYLQNKMVNEDLKFLPAAQVIAKGNEVDSRLSKFRRQFRNWMIVLRQSSAQPDNGYRGRCQGDNLFIMNYLNFTQSVYNEHFIFMAPYPYGLILGALVKLHALHYYECIQDISTDPLGKRAYINRYENLFDKNNRDRVTSDATYESPLLASKEVWINRINNHEQFLAEGEEALQLYEKAIKLFKSSLERTFAIY